MKCTNCGEEIKDGSLYCEHCGADFINPVVLTQDKLEKAKDYNKEIKQKQKEERLKAEEQRIKELRENRKKKRLEKTKGVPYYARKDSAILCQTTATAAGILFIAFPFLNCLGIYVKGFGDTMRAGYSIFTLCKDGYKVTRIYLAVFIIIGIWMLYIALLDNVKKIKIPRIKFIGDYNLISRILPVILGITAIILFLHSDAYKALTDTYKNLQQSFQSMIDGYKSTGGGDKMESTLTHGTAVIAGIIGIASYIFSQCFRFVLDTLNEDEEEKTEEIEK